MLAGNDVTKLYCIHYSLITSPVAIAYIRRTRRRSPYPLFASSSLAPFVTMAEYKQPYPVGTQPRGTAPMQVGGNRNAKNRPIGSDGKRDWSHGLFDCFGSCGTCCMAVWCPCIVYGKNKQRLGNLSTHGTPRPGGGDAIDGSCCVYCGLGLFGIAWVLQIGSRGETRNRYNIRGGTCGDCCSAWCCAPCALTQEHREIELEEHSF